MNSESEKEVGIQWGGYYCHAKEEGGFSVFRLLDFTPQAYHASLFSGDFVEKPGLAELRELQPFIQHVPMSSLQFYQMDMELIGHAPLIRSDLEGYGLYLEHHGCTDEEIGENIDIIMHNAGLGPLALALGVVDDALQVRRL